MAFVRLLFKAAKIERLRRDLEAEKKKAAESSKGQAVKYKLRQRYRHFWVDCGVRIKRRCLKMCTFPEKSCIYRTIYKLKREGTCENFTLKSIAGFISGFFLTYIFFMFFVFQLNFKLSTATIMCSFFGSILTIGLAFSYKVRCVVLLLLPQFFSKRGRQALMAYAFILAITGPAKNTLHNMGILSESLACGQEQLKAAVRQIVEVVKKPFYAIRDAIRTVVKTVKVIVKAIKEILLTIKRVIMSILRVVKAAFQFLAKILNVCNKELGTPFERCMRVFEDAISDCNAKLGPLFNWLCSITYLVQNVCYIVKVFDFICMIVDFISDSIIGVVVRKVKIFIRHVRTMFYVRIKFSHSFHFETNQSKSISEITTGIVTEIRQRTEKLLAVFDFMSCATSMFFLVIILRVLHYRYKFLTSERYDNRFITRNFREVDIKRAQLQKETVLPLNQRERTLYVSVASLRLVKSEKVKLSKAAVALGMITLKLSTHMMADYALYWVLTMIRYHARFQSSVQAPNVVGLHIEGNGFIAKLLKSIVTAFQPLGVHLVIDTIPCLPDPIPPDYDRYIQIASLLVLCWILTIFEPYGLRLRHSVMCYYHPTRARERAIWLYNHIMRSRLSFLKFARRQLRRKFTGDKGIAKITFKEFLRAHIKSKWLRYCFGKDKQEACLLCGEVFRESDPVKPIRCIKPGCPGIYCEQCFADLQNLCTICMEPIQYGDLSDISEEKDSSAEEEEPLKQKKKKKKKRILFKSGKEERKDDDDEDDDDNDYKGKKRLLKGPKSDSSYSENTDSDYYTSGSTTDNSYSYQNVKHIMYAGPDSTDFKFRDKEKQRIPDYASWDSFSNEPRGDSDTESSTMEEVSGEESINPNTTESSTPSGSNLKSDIVPRTRYPDTLLTTRRDGSFEEEIPLANIRYPDTLLPTKRDKSFEEQMRYPDTLLPTKRDRNFEEQIPLPNIRYPATLLSTKRDRSFEEEIPLTNRTDFISSSSALHDFISNKTAEQGLSSETETTFIETPRKFGELQSGIRTETSSLDSEFRRCQKCGKYQIVPRLNLDFGNETGVGMPCFARPKRFSTFLDRFNKHIKYEVVYETPRSGTSSYTRRISTTSPRSPLNVGYQIFAPHYDKFVDCNTLLDVPEPKSHSPEHEKMCIQVNELKDIQRKTRLQEIIKNKENKMPNVTDDPSSESTLTETLSSSTELFTTETGNSAKGFFVDQREPQIYNDAAYKQKIKDYYKKINNKQPADNPTVIKDKNKFLNFIRRVFRKANVKNDPRNQPGSKLFFGKCEENVYISSPKFAENSSTNQESTSSSPTQSSRGHFLSEDSPNTSTRSSGLSLMGSAESHIRGGADIKLRKSEENLTTTTESRTSTDASNIDANPELADVESSDSEITDLDIYLGTRSSKKPIARSSRPNPNQQNTRRRSQPEASMNETEYPKQTETIAPEPAEEITPRYSRQPAERDQDPNNQSSKSSELLAPQTSGILANNSTMSENFASSSEISPRYIDDIRGESFTGSENSQYVTKRGRCCSCPIKPEQFINKSTFKENYGSPNQNQTPPCCAVHVTTKGRPKSATGRSQESTSRRRDSNEGRRKSSQPSRLYTRAENPSSVTEAHFSCICRPASKPPCYNYQPNSGQIEEPRKSSLERSDRDSSCSSKCNRVHFPINETTYIDHPDNQCPDQYCTCGNYQISSREASPERLMDDEVSYCSGYSGRTEFPELVYQNTDEFLELVNELGDTLSLRNKARVEKTIREFEYMSSQNRNLERPILEEESDDQLQIQKHRNHCLCNRCATKKVQRYQPCRTKFTRFDTTRDGPVNQTSIQHYHETPMYMDDRIQNFAKFHNNARWQMNPRTGKWYKVYGDCDYEEDDYMSPPPPPPPRQTCICERRRCNSRNTSDRHGRSCTAPPPSYRCNNCGYPRY